LIVEFVGVEGTTLQLRALDCVDGTARSETGLTGGKHLKGLMSDAVV
jgi:hypothetical protein